MEDLPLDRIAALVPEFAVKDLALGRTLMMMIIKVIRKSHLTNVKIVLMKCTFSQELFIVTFLINL